VAQPGSALVWGTRGRGFKSRPPDSRFLLSADARLGVRLRSSFLLDCRLSRAESVVSVPSRAALPQQLRLLSAALYFLALLGLAKYLNGSFWPPYGLDGLWFYAAAAALLLGEFVLEPFFTRPVDALASALAVLIASATASLEGADISNSAVRTGRVVVMALSGAIALLAIIAIAFKDAPGRRKRLAELASAITARSVALAGFSAHSCLLPGMRPSPIRVVASLRST
jgi:hypothetical protein